MHIMYISLILPISILCIWIISEIILAKSIKKSKNDDSIWLVVNILAPVVGCIIYLLTHNTKKENI